MAKPKEIQLPGCAPIAILHEDRSVIAIDKPAGWMLVPLSWQRTQRNLQAAILSSIESGDYWARSRNLRYLQYVHRLDAETSGVMLFAKSHGALDAIGDLFEFRQVEKVYLAVTAVEPREREWTCSIPLGPDPNRHGRMHDDPRGKEARTDFKWITSVNGRHLIECRPHTGRQHQIRVHLALAGCGIVGDELYGRVAAETLALRAVGLAYWDPFTRKPVAIRAPMGAFLEVYGFPKDAVRYEFKSLDKPAPRRREKMFDRDELDETGEPLETFDAAASAPAPEFRPRPPRPPLGRGRSGDFRPPRRGPERPSNDRSRRGPRRRA